MAEVPLGLNSRQFIVVLNVFVIATVIFPDVAEVFDQFDPYRYFTIHLIAMLVLDSERQVAPCGVGTVCRFISYAKFGWGSKNLSN